MDQILSLSALDAERVALAREIEADRTALHQKQLRLAEIDQARAFVQRYGKRADGSAPLPAKATAGPMITQATVTSPVTTPVSVETVTFSLDNPPPKTRDLIIQAMRRIADVWTDAVTIKDEASKLKGAPIPMSTISPTLSDMKGHGIIVRTGLKVALKERLKETEPPPSGDGSDGDVAERSNAPDS